MAPMITALLLPDFAGGVSCAGDELGCSLIAGFSGVTGAGGVGVSVMVGCTGGVTGFSNDGAAIGVSGLTGGVSGGDVLGGVIGWSAINKNEKSILLFIEAILGRESKRRAMFPYWNFVLFNSSLLES